MTTEHSFLRYHLRYAQQSPIRIGHRKLGNLQTTRLYVPGITIWASTVNRLVRMLPAPPGSNNTYRFWGDFLQKHFRFSCLFFTDPETDDILLPGRNEDRRRLEHIFLDSSVQTPINHSLNIREEGMLHELEWLQAQPVGNREMQTILRGWVDIDEHLKDHQSDKLPCIRLDRPFPCIHYRGEGIPLAELMQQATVGADLNKGCGQLALEDISKSGEKVQLWQVQEKSSVPGQLMPCKARGNLETLVGRSSIPIDEENNTSYKPGHYLYHYLAYLPGAEVEQGTYTMDWFGRFHAVNCAES